jgi:hypothetical protein
MEPEALVFRQQAEAARGGRKRASYPVELREQAVRFLADCRARGGSLRQAAEALGVDDSTLYFWTRAGVKKKHRLKVLPVTIQETGLGDVRRLVLCGPHGLRVEGVGIEDIAALIRALS